MVTSAHSMATKARRTVVAHVVRSTHGLRDPPMGEKFDDTGGSGGGIDESRWTSVHEMEASVDSSWLWSASEHASIPHSSERFVDENNFMTFAIECQQ